MGAAATAGRAGGKAAAVAAAVALVCVAAFLAPRPAEAQTLEAAKKSGKLKLGYRADARPFSFRDDAGKAAGYSVELCEKVAAALKATPEWVPVTAQDRFAALRGGKVDLLCGADSETLSRRKEVSFSVPIFVGGMGALLRTDAPRGLTLALSERPGPSGPLWRGTPTQQLLQAQTFAVVAGTTSEKALNERLDQLQLTAKVVPVKDYQGGVQALLERRASVFFADRPILLETLKENARAGSLILHERRFTEEPIALTLRRGDEDFRLAVDRALSQAFRAPAFRAAYAKWFGEPDDRAAAFFRMSALPD